MNIEQFRQAGKEAIDAICDYYQNLDSLDVRSSVEPGYLPKLIPSEPPKDGENIAVITADFQRVIMPGITHWQHPSFFAYFPSNTSFEGILADLYSASVSNPGFNVRFAKVIIRAVTVQQWACSPACTELEACVMDWACSMLGLSEEFKVKSGKGGGIIMGSASEACLTAATGAREFALRVLSQGPVQQHIREEVSQKLVMYGSTQTHSIGAKAAQIMGITFRAVKVTKEDGYALRGEPLQEAIETDVKLGLTPFFVIGSIGTTSTGALDNLEEVGKVARKYATITYYIDSAWAGVANSCPEFRNMLELESINRYADVYSTNFHKWGLTNFDCSTLWVRDRTLLTNALDLTPEYLRTQHGDSGVVIDYRNWQLALGRKFRSLKLWFVLRSFGVSGFQKHIRKHVELGKYLVELIEQDSRFEIVAPPCLALVCFRLNPAQKEGEQLNKLNQDFFTRIMARSDILLTQTLIPNNVFCIRWAIGAPSTERRHIEAAWQAVQEEANHFST